MVKHDITDVIGSLEPDQPRAIVLDNTPIALIKTEAGVFAVSNTCTHAEANLSDGFVMENWIECPLHQARYDLSTGELLDGPFCPSLPTYEIEQADGRSYISLDT
ncbi:MAG: Rieske (2Fe-2S) protein [Burkholderiaceae bacterium]